jgi:hypothetical protein
VWEDDRNPASDADIYARVVNADGTMDGADFPISTASADQSYPDVAYAASSNRYLAVWEQSADVYGRLVNANKTFVGPEFRIASSSGSLSSPAVAFDPHSGQFLVVWSDSFAWDNIDAKQVGVDGSMPEPVIDLATSRGNFINPALTINSSSHQFLVTWQHQTCLNALNCDDYEKDIFGALYQTTAHFGVYLPSLLRGYSPPILPTPTVTAVLPTATPITPSPPPTQTPTPTTTPTPTPTSTPDPWVTIVTENFEGVFPGAWTVIDDLPGYGEYYWAKRSCRAYGGSYSGWAVGGGANGGPLACFSNYPAYADSWMIYGPFDLTDATDAELRFKAWVNTESPTHLYDYLCRFASVNGANFYGDCISGDSAGWIDQVLDLSNVTDLGDVTGQPNVWVGLWFFSDLNTQYAEGAYVDDIILRKYTSGNCSASSARLPESEGTGLITFPAEKLLDLP